MEDITKNNVNYSLIDHQLIICNAESKTKTQHGQGGTIEFEINIETPASPAALKTGDTFSISITLGSIGTNSQDNTPLFNVVCKMSGTYKVFACPECGIHTANNDNFWSVASGQLLPLVSQYTSDTLLRMGFKNISVPSYVPTTATREPATKTRKKKTK